MINDRIARAVPDEENTRRENPPPRRRSSKFDIGFQMLHHILTTGKLFQLGTQKDCSDAETCLLQLGLICVEFIVHRGRSSRSTQRSLMVLAAAWTGLLMQLFWAAPTFEALQIALSVPTAILSIIAVLPPRPSIQRTSESPSTALDDKTTSNTRITPPEEQRMESPRDASLVSLHLFSASLLLVLLVDRHPRLRAWQVHHAPWTASVPLRFSIPFLLILLCDVLSNWRATDRNSQSLTRHLGTFCLRAYTSAPDYFRANVVKPVLAIGFILGMWTTSSFLSSCLGFRKFILGLPPTPPSFRSGGIFGALLYMQIISIKLVIRYYRLGGAPIGPPGLALILIHALGQMVTGLVVLAGGLYASEILRNDNLKIR